MPQGSGLGPLLFLMSIKDITDIVDVKILLYADDLKLYTYIHSENHDVIKCATPYCLH